jgi:CHASE1-domain containing sensor protein
VILGITASIGVWYQTFASENRAFVQEFDSRAHNQATILQAGVHDYWDQLYALKALFDSSNQGITRDEFSRFSKSLLKGHSAVQSFAWVPRVKREERAAHELAAARDGLTDYHIRAVAPDGSRAAAPDGSMPVSSEQDEYFPSFLDLISTMEESEGGRSAIFVMQTSYRRLHR